MKESKAKNLKLGLYRIYWKCGGTSVASVGQTHDGSRWFAPSNWTTSNKESPMVAGADWSGIKKVELITVA